MGVDLSVGFHHAIAHVLLRIRSVDELLEALHLAAPFIALQGLKFFCRRLRGVQVLHWGIIDRTSNSQHAGDGRATLLVAPAWLGSLAADVPPSMWSISR